MTRSTNVKLWGIRRNKSSKTPSYEVRWIVAGKPQSRTRRTRALAESFLSDLRQAAKRGEAFDTVEGLPESMLPKESPVTWYELARSYIEAKWSRAAGETRKSTLDALATVTPVLVMDHQDAPDATVLRRALLRHALNPPRWDLPVPAEEAAALKWLAGRSRPVADLAEAEVTRSALNAISVTMAGRPAAATTIARKRAVLYNVLKYAVKERKLLDANPIDQVDWKAPEKVEQVDRSVVANPAQARQLLAAVTYVGRLSGRGARLRAMYACMYYGGLRPSEAMGLRRQDCGARPVCLHRRVLLCASRIGVGPADSDQVAASSRQALHGQRTDARRQRPQAAAGRRQAHRPDSSEPGAHPRRAPGRLWHGRGWPAVLHLDRGERLRVGGLADLARCPCRWPVSGAADDAARRSPVRPAACVRDAAPQRGGAA